MRTIVYAVIALMLLGLISGSSGCPLCEDPCATYSSCD
jgi:hypothetical protein